MSEAEYLEDGADYIMDEDTYTADDEEPECGRCDHLTDDFPCGQECGPNHFWGGYKRTEG